MSVTKKLLVFIAIAVVVGVTMIFYFEKNKNNNADVSPEPSVQISVLPTPSKSVGPSATKKPITSGQIDPEMSAQTLRWSQLKGEAYCELRGGVKFINQSVYDNQDAKFIYKGVDHPAREIKWTITPNDNLEIGPNLFSRLLLPDGDSLIGVILPEKPQYKSYELKASITYGRLVDGVIKVYTKDCVGKTTVTLP